MELGAVVESEIDVASPAAGQAGSRKPCRGARKWLHMRLPQSRKPVTCFSKRNKQKNYLQVWARVLEYCVYDDVARMARVSSSFLHEVMPLMKSLYFIMQLLSMGHR